MKAGRVLARILAKQKFMEEYWAERRAREEAEAENLKCSACGVTCHKKAKGAAMGRCSKEAKKLGNPKPECQFIPA